MKRFNEIKDQLLTKASGIFTSTVKLSMDNSKAFEAIKKEQLKYAGLPKDAIADILIRNACRKTKWEGFGNGIAVSGLEAITSAPAPELSHKIASASGVVTLLLGDLAWVTKIQMQLLLEIAHIYDCPFNPEDEDDAYLVFKAAIGMKGTERISSYGRFIFTETARKQFRILLRTGIRKNIQDRVIKLAGPKIGRYLGEKYFLRLIPLANAGIGYYLNNTITKNVGKWAKVKSKIRSSSFNSLDIIKNCDQQSLHCVLPTIFYVSTSNDVLTENSLMLYNQINKRACLTAEQHIQVEKIITNDDIEGSLQNELFKISKEEVKNALLDIAVTSATVNLDGDLNYHKSLTNIAKWLQITYDEKKFTEKVNHVKK